MKLTYVMALIAFIVFPTSCGRKEGQARNEFATPTSTYLYWLKAGVEGDLARSMESMTEASKTMMDQMSKERHEFMQRMTASSAVFEKYSIVDERISGSRAVVLIESPDRKGRVAIPLALEGKEWKIDLVKMFGG